MKKLRMAAARGGETVPPKILLQTFSHSQHTLSCGATSLHGTIDHHYRVVILKFCQSKHHQQVIGIDAYARAFDSSNVDAGNQYWV